MPKRARTATPVTVTVDRVVVEDPEGERRLVLALLEMLDRRTRAIVREEISSATAPPEYLSTRAAGDLAGVAEGTIRRWVRAGRLREHRAGRVVRVLRSDLEGLLQSGRASDENNMTPEQLARRDFG
jgi:excisionase family DNA binding protein